VKRDTLLSISLQTGKRTKVSKKGHSHQLQSTFS